MDKIKFKSNKDRIMFFNSIKNSFGNWKELSTILKVNRNTLLRYKTGESLIPLDVFDTLRAYNKLKRLEKRIILLDSNWGAVKGGKNNYEKNKWIFDLGRKKLMEKHKETDNKVFSMDFNSPLFAEFIGVLIGDGFIGEYNRTRIIQITGHKINDKDYYKKYLIPLIEKLFSLDVHFYERETCIRLTINSKILFNTLKSINFPVGKKKNLEIYKKLIKTDDCKIALIRGLFDTDGHIALERKKYPIIAITTIHKKLAIQIKKILDEFGFGAYICTSKTKNGFVYKPTIFGKRKVLKWKHLIGSSNPYKMKKINASVA